MTFLDEYEEKDLWRLEAVCALFPSSDIWFSFNREDQAIAKSVCKECGVSQECLDFSMREPLGIWGGRTPKERRSYAKKIGIKMPYAPRA